MKVRKAPTEVTNVTIYVHTYIDDDVTGWKHDLMDSIEQRIAIETDCTTLEQWIVKTARRVWKIRPDEYWAYNFNIVYTNTPKREEDGFEISPDQSLLFYYERWGRGVDKDLSLKATMHNGKVWEDD